MSLTSDARVVKRWLVLACCVVAQCARAEDLSLAGTWKVSLREPRTTPATWQPIALPGTLEDAGIGEPLTLKPELTLPVLTRLQRKHTSVGPAWYRREVTIPTAWAVW